MSELTPIPMRLVAAAASQPKSFLLSAITESDVPAGQPTFIQLMPGEQLVVMGAGASYITMASPDPENPPHEIPPAPV